MTFREWLFNETGRVRFPQPVQLPVLVNNRLQRIETDIIDMRFEDWTIDQKGVRIDAGNLRLPSSEAPPRGSFSAPLADGTFLNCQAGSLLPDISPKPQFPTIRADWASRRIRFR